MSIQEFTTRAQQDFDGAIAHLNDEFKKLQIGRASSALVEGVLVESYGSSQPLKNVANISVSDAQTLMIQPWDKGILAEVEKAIRNAQLNLNPQNDGNCIRIAVPPLTEERRRDLSKIVHKLAEDAHISIRVARQKAHDKFKQMQKDSEITEDDARNAEKKLQEKVDTANAKVKEMAKAKESDIMTV